jgi:hypothetical protein
MDSLLRQQPPDAPPEAVEPTGNGSASAAVVADSLRRAARAEAERDRLWERAQEAEKQLARIESGSALARAESEAALAAALDENDRLRDELERHRGWLRAVESSLSWRLTSGLRRAKANARGRR